MLSMKIPKALRLRTTDPSLDRYFRVGVELEYEHVVRNIVLRGLPWQAVRDGSLRDGGVELVSRPLSYRDVTPAVRRMMELAARAGARATPRCGLHLHLNMRPYTVGNVLSLSIVYGLAEPTVFARFAEGRDQSPFCVPQYANTGLIQVLQDDTQAARMGRRPALSRLVGTNKYSALNYACLSTFGTVEARQLGGTLDPQEARRWIEFWKRVVDYSVQFHDPLHVLDEYYRSGLEDLQVQLFGEAIEVDVLDQEDAEDAVTLIAGAADDQEELVGRLQDMEQAALHEDLIEEDEFLDDEGW